MKKLFSLFALVLIGLLPAQQNLLQRKWKVTGLQGFTKNALIKRKAYINLKADRNGQYDAWVGCNTIRMKASFGKSNRLSFHSISSTRMACRDWGLEARFKRSLHRIYKYRIHGNNLYLYTRRGQVVMRLVAK